MALLCAAIRRDSLSLLRFSFLSHIQIYSCEVSLVFRMKYPYSCFSSPFCFLVIAVLLILVLFVLFLVTVISLCSHFFMLSWSHRIEISTLPSMLLNSLPPSFLDTYILSVSSLKCKTLCIIISFLVLCCICWSSLPPFISRMVPSILQGEQSRCLSLWWDFYNIVWFRVVFLFSWDTLLNLFFSSPLIMSASNILKFL